MNITLKNLNRLLMQNLINYYEESISHNSYIKNSLAISRLMAQKAAEVYCQSIDEHNRLRRMNERFIKQGVTIAPIQKQLEMLEEKKDLSKELMGMIGNILIDSLDEWQEHGAEYEDLFNFCDCSQKVIDKMEKDIADGYTKFSDLVCINYSDYKGKRKHTDRNEHSPITCAVTEYGNMKNPDNEITDIFFELSDRDNARHQMSELLSSIISCGLGEAVDFEVIPIDTDFYE